MIQQTFTGEDIAGNEVDQEENEEDDGVIILEDEDNEESVGTLEYKKLIFAFFIN